MWVIFPILCGVRWRIINCDYIARKPHRIWERIIAVIPWTNTPKIFLRQSYRIYWRPMDQYSQNLLTPVLSDLLDYKQCKLIYCTCFCAHYLKSYANPDNKIWGSFWTCEIFKNLGQLWQFDNSFLSHHYYLLRKCLFTPSRGVQEKTKILI